MPWPRVPEPLADWFWGVLNTAGVSLCTGPAELPPLAGLFEHRPRRHHGGRAGLWRKTGRVRRDAAHAVPWRYQAADVLCRRQRAATLRLALLPQSARCHSPAALDRRIVPAGNLRRDRHAAVQHLPERVY